MALSKYDLDVQVCSDLITNYPLLFNVDNLEVEKERRMLEVLEKINFPTPTSMKRSGDIRMWIYIESRTSGDCISLILHPSLTAAEAVNRAGQEAGLEAERLEEMFIHEVVLGGSLERPLHHTDKLLQGQGHSPARSKRRHPPRSHSWKFTALENKLVPPPPAAPSSFAWL